MIGYLFTISEDYDKVADCQRIAIKFSKYFPVNVLHNLAHSLFFDNKPDEAHETLFLIIDKSDYKIEAFTSIGLVYLYIENFR